VVYYKSSEGRDPKSEKTFSKKFEKPLDKSPNICYNKDTK
jgi:hypothetical protein